MYISGELRGMLSLVCFHVFSPSLAPALVEHCTRTMECVNLISSMSIIHCHTWMFALACFVSLGVVLLGQDEKDNKYTIWSNY